MISSPMASGLVSVQSGSSAQQLLFRYPLRCLLSSLSRSNKSTFSSAHSQTSSGFNHYARSRTASLTRNFVTSRSRCQWKNETPPGGLTELYVYRPENPRIWPDPVLGVFSPKDPRCCLPGNVGLDLFPADLADLKQVKVAEEGEVSPGTTHDDAVAAASEAAVKAADLYSTDLFTRYTDKEHQAQTLHSACDYLQNTADAEASACCDILEAFPELDGMRNLHCQLREAPALLKRELQGLFPGRDVIRSQLSVITLAQKTLNDMTGWSIDVEDERESLVHTFITAAKEICGRLHGEGYWADFIDPTSGKPYLGQHTNTTLFETDEKYRMLGFQIEDLGCCKVITHRDFGRNVFVGTIFTDAHPDTGVVQDMFEDMKVLLEAATAAARGATVAGGSATFLPSPTDLPTIDLDALEPQNPFGGGGNGNR